MNFKNFILAGASAATVLAVLALGIWVLDSFSSGASAGPDGPIVLERATAGTVVSSSTTSTEPSGTAPKHEVLGDHVVTQGDWQGHDTWHSESGSGSHGWTATTAAPSSMPMQEATTSPTAPRHREESAQHTQPSTQMTQPSHSSTGSNSGWSGESSSTGSGGGGSTGSRESSSHEGSMGGGGSMGGSGSGSRSGSHR